MINTPDIKVIYTIGSLLSLIKQNIIAKTIGNQTCIKFTNYKENDIFEILLPIPNAEQLIDDNVKNIPMLFSTTFGTFIDSEVFYHSRYPNVSVTVEDKSPSPQTAISYLDAISFGQLFTIGIRIYSGLRFTSGACYPSTYKEHFLWSNGFFMNCISTECSQRLKTHNMWDTTFVGDCNSINSINQVVNIIADGLNTKAAAKVSITQTVDLATTRTPAKRARTHAPIYTS